MFEDSLVESPGRIRSRSKWFAIGSFILQAALVAALVLIPFLHPAALPKQALTMMLPHHHHLLLCQPKCRHMRLHRAAPA